MKKLFCVFALVFALVMSGCAENFPDAEMPDIVFKKCTDYNSYAPNEDDPQSSVTFLDKNGRYYHSFDSEICGLSNSELVKALKSGDERITKLEISCDAGELRKNYNKLSKVIADGKCEFVYDKPVPAVEANSTTWYGLYYDEGGKLTSFPIHANRNLSDIETNDDRANEVYEWYKDAHKK